MIRAGLVARIEGAIMTCEGVMWKYSLGRLNSRKEERRYKC
jgi:hypothetical protein